MKMAVQWRLKVSAEKFLTKFRRPIKVIWVPNTLLMMARRLSSLLALFPATNLTSLLFLKKYLLAGVIMTSFDFFFPCEISRLFPFLQSLICFDILFICRNHAGNDTNDADRKRSRRPNQTKKFMVEISYAAKIPMQAIASALQGKETENLQDALRVLDIILRQSAARQ